MIRIFKLTCRDLCMNVPFLLLLLALMGVLCFVTDGASTIFLLYIILTPAFVMNTEFPNGSLKLVASLPVTRAQIVLSKYLSSYVIIGALAAVSFLSSRISGEAFSLPGPILLCVLTVHAILMLGQFILLRYSPVAFLVSMVAGFGSVFAIQALLGEGTGQFSFLPYLWGGLGIQCISCALSILIFQRKKI